MATGDQQDFERRLASLLPPSWFGTGLTTVDSVSQTTQTPVLNSVLAGQAFPLSWSYVLYQYVLEQARLATATGVWLDRISYDFCGTNLPRRSGELDSSYRARIKAEILRPRQTRSSITRQLVDTTGNVPLIMETWNPGDCGGYDATVCGYDDAGAYGDLALNNQVFVTAYRPSGGGVNNVDGYNCGGGGYDVGVIEYVDQSWVTVGATDAQIYEAVAQIVAAGITAWVAIQSKENVSGAPLMYFGDIKNSQDLAVLTHFFF